MTMRLGGKHNWRYQSTWHEKKVAPGRWRFTSPQVKTRLGKQMQGFRSTPRGTTFLWNIRATQRMKKVGPNRYVGQMTGTKSLKARMSR